MPKRKRREQQHLRQESSRRRSYTVGGTAPQDIYRPGFPMNLLGNIKVFSIVGIVVAVLMVGGAVWARNQSDDRSIPAVPSPTPTSSATVDPSATASPSATPVVKTFTAAEQVIDAATKNYTATIKTNKGDIVLKLNADAAPKTVNSFVFLARQGYFDNITFHRVVANFVIQGGDPLGNGQGGPGYQTQDEPNQAPNKRGTLSMAKSRGSSTFGSQFFINLKDNPSLDFNNTGGDKFYPFAEVTAGMDVVDAISKVATSGAPDNKPVEPVTITTVTVAETNK